MTNEEGFRSGVQDLMTVFSVGQCYLIYRMLESTSLHEDGLACTEPDRISIDTMRPFVEKALNEAKEPIANACRSYFAKENN